MAHLNTKFGGNLSTRSQVNSNRDSPRPLPPPWPVYLAGENGKKFSWFWLHHVWSDVREKVWFGSFSLPFLLFCLVLWSYMTSGSCYWCETFVITPSIYFICPLKRFLSCLSFPLFSCYLVILHNCSDAVHIQAPAAHPCRKCPLLSLSWTTICTLPSVIVPGTGSQPSYTASSEQAPIHFTAENSLSGTPTLIIL